MEVIWHKAPGDSSTIFREQSLVKVKKNYIVLPGIEDLLPVISLVVDMINIVRSEKHDE
jgi:hypothetical protein